MAFIVRVPRRQSVLSNVSLELEDAPRTRHGWVFGSSYRRKGYHIVRLRSSRRDRSRKHRVCYVPPVLGWYPSQMANFNIGPDKRLSPQRVIQLVPNFFNPSVWDSLRHEDCLALRVPKDREGETWQRLYEKGLWYHGAKNLWFKRKRRRSRPHAST